MTFDALWKFRVKNSMHGYERDQICFVEAETYKEAERIAYDIDMYADVFYLGKQ